jgi:two-component system, LytTR family, sensor kinase
MDRETSPPQALSQRAPGIGWSRWRVFIAAWLIYSAFRLTHLMLIKVVDPADPPSIANRVGLGILDGMLAGLAMIVLVAVGERLPIERPHRLRNIILNASLALICSVVTLTVLYAAGHVVAPEVRTGSLIVFVFQSLTNMLFAFLTLAAIVQAAAYQRRYHDREVDALRLQAELSAARLESLRAKLHPHFLFNTLNGISGLIYTDPRTADALVLRLAQLLRATLDTVDDEISVRQELELLSAYLDIERVRFGDRLRVSIDAGRAAIDARIPPFLIQPLAENAIQHGIAPRATGGAITLRAFVRPDDRASTLVLELADDGVGIAHDAREGIGLSITRQRLRTLYRGAGALTVAPRDGGGTVATIELPFAGAIV